ncbi:MAG: hypothetical protein E7192_00500 [Erysipelotrichaceae bacterium]|nr:hypothetical protein [Erysipelotrichaceae bacterium]
MELSSRQKEIMDIAIRFAKNRVQDYCEVQEINNFSLIVTPATPCDYQNGINYYISDPLLSFKTTEDEIIRKTDLESFVVFRENEALYFTERDIENGYSTKGNKELFTELFQNKENFVLLSSDGNKWLISENRVILLSLGKGSPETIDDSIVNNVRKKVLKKYQYSFYQHLISFDE